MRQRLVSALALPLMFLGTALADDPNGLFFKPIPAKTVVLSFDDGCLSHSTVVAPLLKTNGLAGTFYISGAFTDTNWYMTWPEIKSLETDGFEVGSHTMGHGYMEFGSSKDCIAAMLDFEALCLSKGVSKPVTIGWPLYSVNWNFLDALYKEEYFFGRGGHERAYKPTVDSPFDVPSFTIHDGTTNTFYSALSQATAGQIVVYCFHGVPDLEHPPVSLQPATFTNMVNYLKSNNYNVLSMRNLGRYIGRVTASISDTPASGHTSTSAVLNTTFSCGATPNWPAVTNHVYAYWNTVNGGTNATRWTNAVYIGTWTSLPLSNLSCTATGLTTNTLYYFTFGISNDWGRVWATNVQKFGMGAPTVDNSAGATNLVVGVTQLRGTLFNGVADVYFHWGTTDGGTDQAAWGNTGVLPGVNVGSLACTINVSNQLYGAPLYYRCYASNNYGTAWAPASTMFTTMKPTVPPPLPVNGSFETPVIASGTYQSCSGTGWSGTPLIDAISGTWFFWPGYVPDGRQAAVMNGTGSLSQSLTFSKPGRYTVMFNAVGRGGYGCRSLNIQIDGVDVLFLPASGIPGDVWQDSWPCYTSAVIAVSAGAHTLAFVSTNTAESGATSIDKVRLDGAGVLITLTNAAATGYAGYNATSAVLNATLTCTGSVYDVLAYWNTNNCGTNAALWTNSAYLGARTNLVSANLSCAVSELSTNTQYFFTFRATNTADDLWATNVLSFGPSAGKDILTFGVPALPQTVAIVGTNINWTVPYSSALTSLAPTYTVSPFAVGAPLSGTDRDFTYPQTYSVTAQNGSTKAYLVTATNAPVSSAKNILTFVFPTFTNVPAIVGTNIGVTAPYATIVTSMAPTYTVSALAAGAPPSGTKRNFTTPQTYTITAEDHSTKAYQVTVAVAPAPPVLSSALLDVSSSGTGAEILTNGTLVAANHFGGVADGMLASAPVTLASGLTFGIATNHMVSGWYAMHSTSTDAHGHVPSLTNPSFSALMRSYFWIAYGSSVSYLTIPSLKVGHSYRLQLVSTDPQNCTVSVEGGSNVTWSATAPSRLNATWTAGDTVANVVLTRTAGEIDFTGYALHDTTVASPYVDITNVTGTFDAPLSATNGFDIAGTNNAATVGNIWWTNTLGGGVVPAGGSTGWMFTALLALGTNVITVSGSNVAGTVYSDSATVNVVPEPATVGAILLCVSALVRLSKRGNRQLGSVRG